MRIARSCASSRTARRVLLGMISMPLWFREPKREINALDVTFGDADGKTLYISAGEAVFKLRLRTAGIIPGMPR